MSVCTSSHKCPIIYNGQYHSINKTEILLNWRKVAVQLTISLKSGVRFLFLVVDYWIQTCQSLFRLYIRKWEI